MSHRNRIAAERLPFVALIADDVLDADDNVDALVARIKSDWIGTDEPFDVAVWSESLLVAVVLFRPGLLPTAVLLAGVEPLDLPAEVLLPFGLTPYGMAS